MKRLFVLLIPIFILIACSNGELEEKVADQEKEIEELKQEIAELDNKQGDVEEIHMKIFNDILINYQDDYEEFNPEVAVDMYNVLKVSNDMNETKEELLDEQHIKETEMYRDYLDEVIGLEKTFDLRE